jgi:amino acid transporter
MIRNSPLRPMLLLFILVNTLFIAAKHTVSRWGIDYEVVIVGNLILCALTICAFLVTRRSLHSENPNVFVRAMYGSFMIKLFACAIAAFTYFIIVKPNVNKQGIIVCMGLYIAYTAIEVSSLTKLLRHKKNA